MCRLQKNSKSVKYFHFSEICLASGSDWPMLLPFCVEHSSESANFIALLHGATLLLRSCQMDQILLPKIGLQQRMPYVQPDTSAALRSTSEWSVESVEATSSTGSSWTATRRTPDTLRGKLLLQEERSRPERLWTNQLRMRSRHRHRHQSKYEVCWFCIFLKCAVLCPIQSRKTGKQP